MAHTKGSVTLTHLKGGRAGDTADAQANDRIAQTREDAQQRTGIGTPATHQLLADREQQHARDQRRPTPEAGEPDRPGTGLGSQRHAHEADTDRADRHHVSGREARSEDEDGKDRGHREAGGPPGLHGEERQLAQGQGTEDEPQPGTGHADEIARATQQGGEQTQATVMVLGAGRLGLEEHRDPTRECREQDPDHPGPSP